MCLLTTVSSVILFAILIAGDANAQKNAVNEEEEYSPMVDKEDRAQFELQSEAEVESEIGTSPHLLLAKYKTSDIAVAQQHPEMFVSSEEAVETENEWTISHQRQRHDCDRCCPTHVFYKKPIRLLNTRGQTKVLVHFPRINKYQFVRYADCVPSAGYCNGHCEIENITTYLLVWDINSGYWFWPFSIDKFSVPGYCSCKRR